MGQTYEPRPCPDCGAVEPGTCSECIPIDGSCRWCGGSPGLCCWCQQDGAEGDTARAAAGDAQAEELERVVLEAMSAQEAAMSKLEEARERLYDAAINLRQCRDEVNRTDGPTAWAALKKADDAHEQAARDFAAAEGEAEIAELEDLLTECLDAISYDLWPILWDRLVEMRSRLDARLRAGGLAQKEAGDE